jgi:hypothetical protein
MMIKKRHIFITLAACALIATVKMCKSEDYTILSQQAQDEVENFEHLQHESDSLLTEVLHEIDTKQHQYDDELERLNKIILNDNLSSEQIESLKKKIVSTQNLLEIERSAEKSIELVVLSNMSDSVAWNIIERDSVVWNIIFIDSIVKRTVYKIDTIHYDSDEIRRIKLKN